MNIEKLGDWNWLLEKSLAYGIKLIAALAILVIGFWIAGRLSAMISKQLNKTDLTVSLRRFITSVMRVMFKILVVLVAMTTVGVETTAFVALIGGLFVGVGMALQGSLSNLAGGLLIMLFKPFKVGDVIESLSSTGTVQEISILQTILVTPDRKTVVLPNGSVFNNPIINYSKEGIRRVDIGIGISYNDNFIEVQKILMQVLRDEKLLLPDLGFTCEIAAFGDSSVNLAMNGFCKTENYLETLWSLNNATKHALDANGFNIPFPQRDIHIIPGAASNLN